MFRMWIAAIQTKLAIADVVALSAAAQLIFDINNRLGQAIVDVKDKLGSCAQCNNISDGELCLYCRDPHREHSQICVVEESHNILPIETTRAFRGLYHVLHGAISPLRGIGPEQLKIKGLVNRVHENEVQEVILATNPTVEGEATAVYLSRLLKPLGPRVTR